LLVPSRGSSSSNLRILHLAAVDLGPSGVSLPEERGDVGVQQPPGPCALGTDDAAEDLDRPVQVVVHDHEVELAHGPYLLAGASQALLYLLLGVGAPAPEAAFQLAQRRRGDEH